MVSTTTATTSGGVWWDVWHVFVPWNLIPLFFFFFSGVNSREFIARVNTPIRLNDSQLTGAGSYCELDEDPYQGRGRRIVYQGSNGSDFQSQYDYLNSGFLTPDQRKEKLLMQNIVSTVQERGLEMYE